MASADLLSVLLTARPLNRGVSFESRLAGVLLGTALGDALGLPAEGMPAARAARRFGRLDRFRLLGDTGYVSDDTEQAALVAQSLGRFPEDPERCAADFRRALVGWFARLPWGAGMATIRACARAAVGLSPSGVRSAGNGAAMRAAVVGVFFHDDPDARRRYGRALAEVTHLDERAIAGALFVAELSAELCRQSDVSEAFTTAVATVEEPQLAAALSRAAELAGGPSPTPEVSEALGVPGYGVSGYVIHTVPYAAFCLLRHRGQPLGTLVEAYSGGGDTDSFGAILGGWLGAAHGEAGLPEHLVGRIHDGPFGPSHLRRLAAHLANLKDGEPGAVPGYAPTAALVRNLALHPVILGHGLRRLLP